MAKLNRIAIELSQKIRSRKARVAIIGLGYVGLPMACELARSGFTVVGIDTDSYRVRAIGKGRSFLKDIPSAVVQRLVRAKRLSASSSFTQLATSDVIMICVPTPLNKIQDPDLSYIVSATTEIKKFIRKGQLIILESTTYPGTTDEVILPELERDGLKVGRDFFLCFSPERIDPGNPNFRTGNIPKVVGGVTEICRELGTRFYGLILKKVVPVSSTRAAEMTKLLENTFRIVNIGLINELAIVAKALGIDIWEVIEAARTKPFGFMPFYPGPGVGGHCIGIDPVYLSWKARHHGKTVQFVDLARLVNTQMPDYISDQVVYILNERARKGISGAKIMIVGVTYKADVADIRESPALEIINRLGELGARVDYHDPYIHELKNGPRVWQSKVLTASALRSQDLVLLITNHKVLNYTLIARNSKTIFDTRNSFKNCRSKNIVKL